MHSPIDFSGALQGNGELLAQKAAGLGLKFARMLAIKSVSDLNPARSAQCLGVELN